MNLPVPESPSRKLLVGEKLRVSIEDIAFGGEGVARVEQMVVFVPFVILGEEVEVEVTEVKKNFARASLLNVIKPSPLRVTPLCPYFGTCGGCQYQHIEYSAQLELKRKQVTDLLRRIGHFGQSATSAPSIVSDVIPCPQQYGYRNRIMIRSQWDKYKQGLNIGFIRADNRLVVDIEECKIAEPGIDEQIRYVRAHPPPKGGLKVVLRVVPEGWELPPDSFFQNNFILLPKLVGVVRERFQENGSRFLIDAYCGVGFFSLELAEVAEFFVGIELDAQAIKAARINAANRQRSRGEFLHGRTEELLPRVLERFPASSSTVLVDPPRVGCARETLEILRKTRPAQVIYISCHPATLARDLNVLCSDGVFELKKVVPLDMFPQTQHVECVADLRAIVGN